MPTRMIATNQFTCANAQNWAASDDARGTSCMAILTYWPECCKAFEEMEFDVQEDTSVCLDTDNGKVDHLSRGCEWYARNYQMCEIRPAGEFNPKDMCCACGGGIDSDPMASVIRTKSSEKVVAGDTEMKVLDTSGLSAGVPISIRSKAGMEEFREITSSSMGAITLDRPFRSSHPRGTTVTAMSSVYFDCEAGYSMWDLGWSEMKKKWCCAREEKGCSFDCKVDAARWEEDWTM